MKTLSPRSPTTSLA